MGAIVLASAAFAIRTARDLNEATRSQDVRALTIDVLQAVTSAETGQRGYLLTGKEEYLDLYSATQRDLPGLLDRLGAELGPDPDFRQWRTAIRTKLGELAQTVALGRAGQRDAALRIVQTDFGEHTMDSVRAIAARLAGRQRAVLVADIARSKASANTVVIINLVSFAVLLALASFVVRGAVRTVARMRATQAALEAANAELGRGRERLEAAVQARTKELSGANEEIQRFAYIVSHDLRAPLLNIIGFTGELEAATGTLGQFVAQHLRRDDIDVPDQVRIATEEDLPEAIRFIQSSTSKMDRLINAILRLSREGRRVLMPERLDMAALLGGIVESLKHQTEAAGAEIDIAGAPPLVSDRIAVEQLFTNLIENALKYPEPGRPGRIRVTGERRGARTVWRVADNGRGIEARDLERVFELFRRAGAQDVPGEGIGLAHVRALARRLGGDITCESTPHAGSVFIVRLPAVLQHAEESET